MLRPGWNRAPIVTPVSEGMFAGAFDMRQVNSFGDKLKFRLAAALGYWPQGDHRDWSAIRAWAENTGARLG